ncbi:MAG: type IA DNA topoisomerase [Clostridioides sp.]|jgi:DNA topoisomerase-3|nr:type IA DNA topoisomerase [Clostridioides sp.]
MKLILAEKPSVAKTISSFLGANKRNDGFFQGNDYIVTYAVGHLVGLYDMKDYDKAKYSGSWKINNFPFFPAEKFKFKVDKSKKKQFDIISELIKRNDIEYIINATDNDREGELIAFLIFLKAKNKKPVKRILVNEWTPEDIKRGLSSLKDEEQMRNLQAAGYTRLITDWLIGINFTSVATLKYGNGKLLNIGRVILPTVKLIYDRDSQIKNFVPQIYYEIDGKFKANNGEYTGKLVIDEDYISRFKKNLSRNNSLINNTKKDSIVCNKDSKNTLNIDSKINTFEDNDSKDNNSHANERITSLELANEIISAIQADKAQIKNKKVTTSKEYAPKLFSLTSLQGYITSKYSGFTSDKVLKICQSLYEGKGKGGFITYPRTDSIYLEESLASKAEQTLNKLKIGLPYENKIKFAKTKRVFDSSKVDSHSAITPTYIIPKSLTSDEQIVYNAIKNRFIANFMPPAEYENTEIKTVVTCDELTLEKPSSHIFLTKGKVLKNKGFLEVFGKEEKDSLLPYVDKGEVVDVLKIESVEKQTTPPKPYTEDTLLKAMKNCGKNVPDDDTTVLSGYSIGTSSTRAEVLKKIETVGYVKKKGKSYSITELGINLVEIFPVKELFDVDYTGKLEKNLSDIQKGDYTKKEYLSNIFNFIYRNVEIIKNDIPRKINTEEYYYNPKTKKFTKAKTSQNKTSGNSKSTKSKTDSKTKSVSSSKNNTKSKTSSRVGSNDKHNSKDVSLGKCPLCGNDVYQNELGFFCENSSNCDYKIEINDKVLANFSKKPNKTMVKSLLKKGEATVKSLKGKDGNKFDAILKYEKNPSNGRLQWLIKKL